MTSHRAIIFVVGLTLALAACARVHARAFVTPQVSWTLALPSGEVVTIVRESHDSFVNVDHQQKRILGIDYITDHQMDDEASLRMEARRVFAAYKTRIDVSDYNTVVLAAMKHDAGGSIEGRPYYFERAAANQWVLQP